MAAMERACDPRGRRERGVVVLRVCLALGLVTVTMAPSAHAWPVPVATTTHFAFHSDFATNLNDALLEAGRARNDERPELFTVEPERSCFEALAPSEQRGWHHAVGYYADVISTGRWSGRLQVVLRMALSGVEQREQPRDLRFLGIARGMLDAAAPAFRACRWPVQDAENRRWIERLVADLEQHAEAVSERLARYYEKPLGGLPMRVDVMETVNWSGATTWILDPAGGHIQISREEPALAALELVFHEASHTLMGHDAPIRLALGSAADQLGVELPRDLWHGVLFYTTGETVRRVLDAVGEEYTPMMVAGDIFGRYLEPLEQTWPAYLEGRRSLDKAAADLLRTLELPAAGDGR